MSRIDVLVNRGTLKEFLADSPELENLTNAALEKVVDADISEFDKYFRSLGNDPLSKPEFAIIKTYLAWKLLGQHDKPAPDPAHAKVAGAE